MEQVINKYQSPYRMRTRKIEVDKKALKYWEKFIKQTIISAGILVLVISCENVEVIANSGIWNKATEIAKSDMNVEQVKNGIERGIEYVKVSVPGILNSEVITNAKEENNTIIGSVEEIKAIVPEVDPTEGMTQEEKDIYNIVKATTILRPLNG